MNEYEPKIRINLLHDLHQARRNKTQVLIAWGVFFFFTLQLVGGLSYLHHSLQQEVAREQHYQLVLEEELEARAHLYLMLQDYNQHQAGLEAQERLVRAAEQEKARHAFLLEEIETMIPVGLWLYRLEMEKDQLHLRGRAKSPAAISSLVQELNRSDRIGDIKSLESRWERDQGQIQFVISCTGVEGLDQSR